MPQDQSFPSASSRPAPRGPRDGRDLRIDVLRGAALVMIFIDHIPDNPLAYATLHNFALCDAAEVFVLLAGISAALAYGKAMDRDGWKAGAKRVARRCWQLYLAQVGIVLFSLVLVKLWISHFGLQSFVMAPILHAPAPGILYSLLLMAQPDYLNILPLYVVLLAAFPAVWLAMRRSAGLALLASGALWGAAGHLPALNLPNWVTHDGWYFDPFAWQLLLVLGVAAARVATRNGGSLPWRPALVAAAAGFLLVTLPHTQAWHLAGLPDPWPAALGGDKTHLEWSRVLSVAALAYLVLSSDRMRALAGDRRLALLRLCGRHSLEVFVTGCLCALLARTLFRTFGSTAPVQVLTDAAGILAMVCAGWWAERARPLLPAKASAA